MKTSNSVHALAHAKADLALRLAIAFPTLSDRFEVTEHSMRGPMSDAISKVHSDMIGRGCSRVVPSYRNRTGRYQGRAPTVELRGYRNGQLVELAVLERKS